MMNDPGILVTWVTWYNSARLGNFGNLVGLSTALGNLGDLVQLTVIQNGGHSVQNTVKVVLKKIKSLILTWWRPHSRKMFS